MNCSPLKWLPFQLWCLVCLNLNDDIKLRNIFNISYLKCSKMIFSIYWRIYMLKVMSNRWTDHCWAPAEWQLLKLTGPLFASQWQEGPASMDWLPSKNIKIRHENFLPGNANERLLEKDVIHVSTKLHKKRLSKKKKKVLLFCSQILEVQDKLTTKSVLFCFSMQ